jgi:hypothetical protein
MRKYTSGSRKIFCWMFIIFHIASSLRIMVVVEPVELQVASFVLTKDILGIQKRQRLVNTLHFYSVRSLCSWCRHFFVCCILNPLRVSAERIFNANLSTSWNFENSAPMFWMLFHLMWYIHETCPLKGLQNIHPPREYKDGRRHLNLSLKIRHKEGKLAGVSSGHVPDTS